MKPVYIYCSIEGCSGKDESTPERFAKVGKNGEYVCNLHDFPKQSTELEGMLQKWENHTDRYNLQMEDRVFGRSLIVQAYQSGHTAGQAEIYDDLDTLLVNGHGGGNFRRLIMTLKGKYGASPLKE